MVMPTGRCGMTEALGLLYGWRPSSLVMGVYADAPLMADHS